MAKQYAAIGAYIDGEYKLMGFEYKEKLKALLPDYIALLEKQGRIEHRRGNYYTCPFCGSGNRENHTSAFNINETSFKCFACSEKGDIFDLVGHMEGLPKGDFIRQYNRTVKIMRPYMVGDKPEKSGVLDIPKSEPVDYTEYLHKCHQNIEKTDYFQKRGLSKKIIDRFKLGCDVEKNIVTIPYNPDCKGYVHRALWDCGNKYCKHGNELFNADALYFGAGAYVFVAEGQIDALSFEEIGVSTVGLGGANEISKIVNQLKEKPCNKILVIAFDNDKVGRRATGKLIEELAEAGLSQNYIVDSGLYGENKDANEFLLADKERFRRRMEKIIEDDYSMVRI